MPFVRLWLDAGGVQVTQTLSSKFKEKIKLIFKYWAAWVEQGFPSDPDDMEVCI